jgi:hypothetical protein
LKTTLKISLLSFLTAVLLSLYIMMAGWIKFLFSFAAIGVGIFVFANYSSWKIRIAYIAASVLLSILFAVIIAIVAFVLQNPPPAAE